MTAEDLAAIQERRAGADEDRRRRRIAALDAQPAHGTRAGHGQRHPVLGDQPCGARGLLADDRDGSVQDHVLPVDARQDRDHRPVRRLPHRGTDGAVHPPAPRRDPVRGRLHAVQLMLTWAAAR